MCLKLSCSDLKQRNGLLGSEVSLAAQHSILNERDDVGLWLRVLVQISIQPLAIDTILASKVTHATFTAGRIISAFPAAFPPIFIDTFSARE